MVRKLIYLTLVSLFVALVHSCSLNNEILTPPCKIFEADLTDRWWYPENGNSKTGIYFASNGNCMKKSSNDSLTYTLQSCNKINIINHTQSTTEQMELGKLIPNKMTVIKEAGKEETYRLYPTI